MKRVVSFILSVLFVFSGLSSITVYADEDEDRRKNDINDMAVSIVGADFLNGSTTLYDYEGAHTPDDAFESDYAEYKNKDGSVTYVYDSGCVGTIYKDGSSVAVDYRGNEYIKDKDGNLTIKTVGGFEKYYGEDKVTITQPGGLKTVYDTNGFNKDGSYTGTYSEELGSFGMVKEYDADHNLVSIGFIGSDEKLSIRDGMWEQGTIHGPNGATYTHDDTGIHAVSPNGDVFDQKSSMNWSEHTSETVSNINWKNGASYSENYTSWDDTGNGGGHSTDMFIKTASGTDITKFTGEDYLNGKKVGEADNCTVTYVGENGNIYTYADVNWGEWNQNGLKELNHTSGLVVVSFDGTQEMMGERIALNVDDNGNIVSATNMEVMTGEDGSVLAYDRFTGFTVYKDDNQTLCVDSDGVLRQYEDKYGNYVRTEYDDEGNVVSTTVDTRNGATYVSNSDSDGTITLPDGTEYKISSNGNIFKDGNKLGSSDEKAEGVGVGKNDGFDRSEVQYPELDDICGTWEDVSVDVSNLKSAFIETFVNWLCGIFGADPDAVMEDTLQDSGSATITVYVEKIFDDTAGVTISSDGGYSYYEGKYKNGTLTLKLKRESGDSSDGISVPVNKMTLNFTKKGKFVYLNSSMSVKTFVVSCDIAYSGRKAIED